MARAATTSGLRIENWVRFMPVVSASVPRDWRRRGGGRWTGSKDRLAVREGDGPRQDDHVAGLDSAGDLDGRRVAESDVDKLHSSSSVNRGEDELFSRALLQRCWRNYDGILRVSGPDHDVSRQTRAQLAVRIVRHDVYAGGPALCVEGRVDGPKHAVERLAGERGDIELDRLPFGKLAELALF